MYVIKKGHLYVAKSGSKSAYTTLIFKAQIYETLEQAKNNKCGNESIVKISYYERSI